MKTQSEQIKLVIIGYKAEYHLGAHLYHAAKELGVDVRIIDPTSAFDGPFILKKIAWRIFDHRPIKIADFSKSVIELCQEFGPHYLIITGFPAVTKHTIQKVQELGSVVSCFLSDDPWNPVHKSRRVIQSLAAFDIVFTPRRSNIDELRDIGCTTEYIPFGYDRSVHFIETVPDTSHSSFYCDVMFYGGADKDRLPLAKAIIDAGYDLHLYGGYWGRDKITRPFWKGNAIGSDLRRAVSTAKVCLCPVRRANRDGHVMRTFEVPAMGGCMLVEDTTEHREIFGREGECVLYYANIDEMIEKLRILLSSPDMRKQLASRCHYLITSQPHTYYDRLVQMLEYVTMITSRRSEEIR